MKLKFRNIFLTLFFISNGAIASDENKSVGAVDKNSCANIQNSTQPFILVLNNKDELISSLSQCASEAKLSSASFTGLGQVHNPTLAYFTSNPNDKPTLTTLSGYYELAALNGNITNNNGKYYTHAHGVFADKKFHGIAGHINDAQVGLTIEITIIPFSKSVERTVDPKTGFGNINLKDTP